MNIYSEQEAEAEINLFLDRVFKFDPAFQLDKFKAMVRFGLNYFYTNKRMCFFGILSVKSFKMDATLKMAFPTLKKNIIDTLWSFDNWASRDAKFLDEIALSSSSETITLYSESVTPLESDFVFAGTKDDAALNCFPGTIATASAAAGGF